MNGRVDTPLALGIACTMILAACGSSPTPISVAPASTIQAATPAGSMSVTASAEVVPTQFAKLGFVVSARVKEVAVSEGQMVRAGQTLIMLDAPDLVFAETAADATLKSAKADELIQSSGRTRWSGIQIVYVPKGGGPNSRRSSPTTKKWNGLTSVWVAGPPELRQIAVAKTLRAQAGLEEAQAELAQAALVAPFDGTVVSVNVVPGEVVQPNTVALVISDLSHLRLETTDLSERVVAQVRIGQTARVRLKAFSQDLTGRVTAIAPMAGISSDGDTVYKVTIELDQQPAGLLWGMTGDVEIQVK